MTKLEQLREAVRLQIAWEVSEGVRVKDPGDWHRVHVEKQAFFSACKPLDLPAILAVVEAAQELPLKNTKLSAALAALEKE